MAKDRRLALSCQQCRNPIDVDASIDQLNPAAFKLLTGKMKAATCLVS
jgi:beclin 1